MSTRHLLSGVAFTLAGLSAASAQWFDGPPGPYGYRDPPGYTYGPGPRAYGGYGPGAGYGRPLPPDAVVDQLEDADYGRIGRPLFDGRTYTVDATAPNGVRVRLVIDAFRGTVLGRHAVAGAPAYGPVPEMGAPVPEMAAPRRRAPEPRRQAVRAEPRGDAGPDPSRGALPAPADQRLAPRPDGLAPRPDGLGPDGTVSSEERRPAARPPRPRRDAVRSEPGKAEPGKPEPRPAAAPKAPAPPPETARPAPARPAEARADAPRPDRPVRVIGGVTPMQPARSPSSQLDDLPQPPAATPPTGMN